MKELENKQIIYVTRDIERALGLYLDTPGYFIISNFTDFGKKITEKRTNIVLIEDPEQLDTWQLLKHPQVVDFINKQSNPNLIVFKNTLQIEKTCQENNWHLLNPPAELSNRVEEKISQLEWLGELKKYLPGYAVDACKNIEYAGQPFILQFNRSHTGSGTMLIESAEQLEEIKTKFPNREVRTADYTEGPLFTNNNIVTNSDILIGNISYQITGLKPFTDRKFATIGNDWGVVKNILNPEQIEQYKTMAREVGEKLKADGWQGAFGIDVVVDSAGKLYLVEVNARQPASTSYESKLQQTSELRTPNSELSTFEAHLASLFNLDLSNYNLIEINDGAQIIQRVTKEIPYLPEPKIGRNVDFTYIKYNNTKPESDLLRIQVPYSFMKTHNELNNNGKQMINFIITTKDGKKWDSDRGGIIAIKDEKVLLMERHKFGQHYFSLPGGTAHDSEDIKTTAVREGLEETGLDFTVPDQEPTHFNVNGRDEYYFFVENIKGEPELGEEEAERNSPNNTYELKWIDIKKLKDINLRPNGIDEIIIKHNQ